MSTSQDRENPAPEYVRRREAARIVKLAVGTLENLAAKRMGPPYFVPKGTRTVLYSVEELHRWINDGRVQPGTA